MKINFYRCGYSWLNNGILRILLDKLWFRLVRVRLLYAFYGKKLI